MVLVVKSAFMGISWDYVGNGLGLNWEQRESAGTHVWGQFEGGAGIIWEVTGVNMGIA